MIGEHTRVLRELVNRKGRELRKLSYEELVNYEPQAETVEISVDRARSVSSSNRPPTNGSELSFRDSSTGG